MIYLKHIRKWNQFKLNERTFVQTGRKAPAYFKIILCIHFPQIVENLIQHYLVGKKIGTFSRLGNTYKTRIFIERKYFSLNDKNKEFQFLSVKVKFQ